MTIRSFACRFFLVSFVVCQGINTLHAQPTSDRGWYQREDIENIDIGWIKPLQFKEPAKPFAQHGWSYTAKQMDHSQKMVTWLQQTYLPKGYLGDIQQSVLAQEPSWPMTSKDYNYNAAEKNNRKALPNTYGVQAKLYYLLKKTADKRFWPIPGLADYNRWTIMANNVELITQQMIYLSSPEEFYCTMPRYGADMKGDFESKQNVTSANYRNFTNSPALQRYDHYMLPNKVLDRGGEKYIVVLTKDRKPLPFEQVTMGDFLDLLERRFQMMYTIQMNNGVRVENLLEKGKKGLQVLKEKYKDQRNEFVYFNDWAVQPDVMDLANIEPNKHISWLTTKANNQTSTGYVFTGFPLLRLKKGVKEACAKGDPQWIVCRMEKNLDGANAGEVHKMETFLERFNYGYVYDYFLGADKVIQPYKPLAFTNAQAVLASTSTASTPSAEATKKAADKSIVFYDDFSTVPIGGTPTNWTTQRSDASGEKVAVVEVNGVSGRWMKLKRKAVPKDLVVPVSGDLELSFDLLVQKGDVPWGSPGFRTELYFSSPQGDKRLVLVIFPGNMNIATAVGWVEPQWGGANCNFSSYYSLPDFTGSKPTNKVTITVRKKGEGFTFLSNGNKVFDCPAAFVAGQDLKSLNFEVNEKNVYHLGNVLLKKL